MQEEVTTFDTAAGECGYLQVHGNEFAVRVIPATASEEAHVEVSPQLRSLLTGQEASVLRKLQHASDAASFVHELRDILERTLTEAPPPNIENADHRWRIHPPHIPPPPPCPMPPPTTQLVLLLL